MMCFNREMSITHSDGHLAGLEGDENLLRLEEALARFVAEGKISAAAAKDFCTFALLDPASAERQNWRYNPGGTANEIYDMDTIGKTGEYPPPVRLRQGMESIGALLNTELERRFPPTPATEHASSTDTGTSGSSLNTGSPVIPSSAHLSQQIETVIGEDRSTRRNWMGNVLKTAGATAALTGLATLHPKARHVLGIDRDVTPDLAAMVRNFPRSFPGTTITVEGDLKDTKTVSIMISMPRPFPDAKQLYDSVAGPFFRASDGSSLSHTSIHPTQSIPASSLSGNPTEAIAFSVANCKPDSLYCSRDIDAWSIRKLLEFMTHVDKSILEAERGKNDPHPGNPNFVTVERDLAVMKALKEAYMNALQNIFGSHTRDILEKKDGREQSLLSRLHVGYLYSHYFNDDEVRDKDPATWSENTNPTLVGMEARRVFKNRIDSKKAGTSVILCDPRHLQECLTALREQIGDKKGIATIIIDTDKHDSMIK